MKFAYILLGFLSAAATFAQTAGPLIYANGNLASGTVTSIGPVSVRIDMAADVLVDPRTYKGAAYSFSQTPPTSSLSGIFNVYPFYDRSVFLTITNSTYLSAGNWVSNRTTHFVTWEVSAPVYFDITPIYTVTVDSAPGGYADPGTAAFPIGQAVSYRATPWAGWTFLRWTGTLESNANPLEFTVGGPATVRSIFGSSINILPSLHGSVAASTNTSGLLEGGTHIQFTASPDPGYYFAGWSGPNAPTERIPFTITFTQPLMPKSRRPFNLSPL